MFEKEWKEIGIRSFARFFDISLLDVKEMEKNPNEVFFGMIKEIKKSLTDYENFMVKIKKTDDKRKRISRLDFLDFRE